MELRPELMPPALDQAKVARLSRLADELDGAQPGEWEEKLIEFNQLAETEIAFEHFQGVSGGEDAEDWVKRILYRQILQPDPTLSLTEMEEIVSRILKVDPGRDFYLELFLINCKHPSGSDLIYWPNLVAELPKDRKPTAIEIAALAISGNPC